MLMMIMSMVINHPAPPLCIWVRVGRSVRETVDNKNKLSVGKTRVSVD